MTPDTNESAENEPQTTAEKFDDEHYPAYSMGRAAELLDTSANFLRSLDEAKLIEPQRSAGGHRRYSRHQLRLAARVRAMVDQGTGLDAACRIVTLEDQLQEAQALNVKLTPPSPPDKPYPPLQSV
jgi:DNA-binding transcriptional MerR regulator